eukprot:TRINITY_DN17080_c0_g1_i1.p1 TRINITY_DN17080_c0_g1~~TRINITY_DN17080_c0_g1_i1.p1  ORF type:complete len:113 (+),score=15.17 TRINITY_DN17080_c0_g1_i1:503-841(+)
MMPSLALSTSLDGFQGVLSGFARGCGWQKIGAYANLRAYYIIGVPVAVLLAFVMHLCGREKKARERVIESSLPFFFHSDTLKDMGNFTNIFIQFQHMRVTRQFCVFITSFLL